MKFFFTCQLSWLQTSVFQLLCGKLVESRQTLSQKPISYFRALQPKMLIFFGLGRFCVIVKMSTGQRVRDSMSIQSAVQTRNFWKGGLINNYARITGINWTVPCRTGHVTPLTKKPVLQSQLCYLFTLAMPFMKSHMDSGNLEAEILLRNTRGYSAFFPLSCYR